MRKSLPRIAKPSTVSGMKTFEVESNPSNQSLGDKDVRVALKGALLEAILRGMDMTSPFEGGQVYQTWVAGLAESTDTHCLVKWSSTPIHYHITEQKMQCQTSCGMLSNPDTPWSYWSARPQCHCLKNLKNELQSTKTKTWLQRILVSNSPNTLLQQTKLPSLLQEGESRAREGPLSEFLCKYKAYEDVNLQGILSKITIPLQSPNLEFEWWWLRGRNCGRHIHVPAVPVRANRHCVDGGRKRTSSQHHALGVHVSPQDASHVFRTLSMYLLFRPPIPYGFASSDLATRSMQPQTGGKNERMQESKRTTLRVFDQKMLHVHANGVLTKKPRRRNGRGSDPQIPVNCPSRWTKSFLAQVSLYGDTSD